MDAGHCTLSESQSDSLFIQQNMQQVDLIKNENTKMKGMEVLTPSNPEEDVLKCVVCVLGLLNFFSP